MRRLVEIREPAAVELNMALALPEGHQVMSAAMVGYPRVEYHRCPERKPLQVQWV